jgi:hypothetical protein
MEMKGVRREIGEIGEIYRGRYGEIEQNKKEKEEVTEEYVEEDIEVIRNTNDKSRTVCPKWRTRQIKYFRASIVLGLKVDAFLFEDEICTLIA